MRISRLSIVNFRSYQAADFTLADRTYFVGPNGAGKSTAIDMLQWVLTGKCRGLDAKNQDLVEFIREGALEGGHGAGARVFVDDFGKMQRETDGRQIFLKVKDWSGSNAQQQSAFYEKVRITEGVILACLDSSAFLRLHHADAKALLMGVLDVRIPEAELEPLGIAGPLSLEELETRYKASFEKRTDERRKLDRIHVPAAPEGDEPPALEDLQAALDELKDQERELLGQGGEARGRLIELRTQVQALEDEEAAVGERIANAGDPNADLDAVENKIRAFEAAHAPKEAAAPAPKAAKGGPSLLDAAEPSPAEKEVGTLRIKLADERGRLKLLQDTVDSIGEHKPDRGCVLASGVPCMTPAAEFSGALKTARTEIKTIEKSIKGSENRIAEIEREIREQRQAADAAAAAERKEAAARLDEKTRLERQKSALTVAISNLQTDEARMTEIMGELANLRTQIANLEGEVQEPEGLEQLRERITRGEQTLNDARAWVAADKAHKDAQAVYDKQRAIVERLELLCEKLGPKGLILDALERARQAFEERVNVPLAKWGYELRFTLDPWRVLVNGRKSTQLSESQKLRVGIALQLAIAEISGLDLVAIDRVDMFDSANRAILADVIDGWKGQIIMAATKDPDYELPPLEDLGEGVAFYHLSLDESIAPPLTVVTTPAAAAA